MECEFDRMKKDYEKLEMEVVDFNTNKIFMADVEIESELPDTDEDL